MVSLLGNLILFLPAVLPSGKISVLRFATEKGANRLRFVVGSPFFGRKLLSDLLLSQNCSTFATDFVPLRSRLAGRLD